MGSFKLYSGKCIRYSFNRNMKKEEKGLLKLEIKKKIKKIKKNNQGV